MTTNYLASVLFGDEEYKKRIAWSKTIAALGQSDIRLDCDGRMVRWGEYGKLSEYGWEIDHIHPTTLGGPDTTDNMRARHWRGNRKAGGILGALFGSGAR